MKKVIQFLAVLVLMVLTLQAGAQFTGGIGRGDYMDPVPAGPLESTDVVYLGGIGRGDNSSPVHAGYMSCVNPTSGGTIAAAQTICNGTSPAAFTSTALPTGHIGTLEYTWQYSTSDSPFDWIDIASSNSEAYNDETMLTADTWYRRLARVSCMDDWTGAAESNVIEVTVVTQPTVTDLLLTPNLDITRFDNYTLSVNVDPKGSNINGVNFIVRPQTASAINSNWDFLTNGTPYPSPNLPLQKVATKGSENAWSFSQLRPDNIYSEIAFIFDITSAPSNSRFWQNSYELMRFTNHYEITPGTSFFIELYATPTPGSPPSADLQVYLVGQGFDISAFQAGGTFANEAWQNHASVELVGTINRDEPFHHNHGPNSSHYLIPLSANNDGKIGNKDLDISDNFWIILTTGNQLQMRGWDMKYHTGCDNKGTWYKGSGTTFTLQSDCPDVHVHFAREETTPEHNGMEVKAVVEYEYNGQICELESAPAMFYFAELPNLPPNASAFIGPATGTYQGDVTISWFPATDPNNDPLTYNIYLINDLGTVSYTVATGHNDTSYTLKTKDYPNDDYDILVEACDTEFCTGFYWSSNIDEDEFFRILNCDLVAGNITAGTGQTICSGMTPSPITAEAPTGGAGDYDYQWQQYDGSNWISVTGGSGDNTLTYTPQALTATTRYRLQQTDTWCDPDQTVETAEVTITVHPEFTPGAIATTGETICSGQTPSTAIDNLTGANGGQGTITYLWKTNGTDIPESNTSSYSPGVLTQNTTFTRWAKDETCQTVFMQSTGEWTVTVKPLQQFRTKAGLDWTNPRNWSTAENWEQYTGVDEVWEIATSYPGEITNDCPLPQVTILGGHSMEILTGSNISIPNLKIESTGKLTIRSGGKIFVQEKLQLDQNTGGAIVVE